ncbi:MAG: carboxymuconolactone decarboxylase family protein [Chloroflexi bacterium]|nr:carboxymuconolactone decarboxylase family protein [Chloroflexota bacterium]
MSQRIELGAIVVREGRLWLVRPRPEGPWELPGGALLPEHDDTDAAMDAILAAFGVSAPAIEDDFLETRFLPFEGGQVVYNLYAASEWTGDPVAAPGVGAGWFGLEELDAIHMEEWLREALLEAFGMKETPDRDQDILAAMSAQAARGTADLSGAWGDPSRQEPGDTPFREQIGRAWENDILDDRSRGIAAVAMLAALGGRPRALREAIASALLHGVTPEQLAEALRMAGAYAGYPAAIEAWGVMAGLFAERGLPTPEVAP